MLAMDVFRGDAFSATSLTAAVDQMDYVPGYLGALPNLFVPAPVRTKTVFIEKRYNAPALIQTSARGAPPKQKGPDNPRDVKSFATVRIAESSRIYAEELQGVREFGEEMAVKTTQQEVARRMMRMGLDAELTKENMRLGCVQGIVTDADGSVIYDWGDEFGQEPAAEIGFNLTVFTDGAILKLANQVRRQTVRSLKGVGGVAAQVHALCSDSFWDEFITNQEIRETYKYAMQARTLQNDVGGAWESFRYGKIVWHNYRGTDDNSTVAVPDTKVKFFPVGAGIFQVAQSPAEKFEFLNTLGQENYTWIVTDKDRDMWADVEQYSYPLHVCTMPQALGSGRIGA